MSADLLLVTIGVLLVTIKLLVQLRRLSQAQPRIRVVYPTPYMRVMPLELADPTKRSLPSGDVEGEYREL